MTTDQDFLNIPCWEIELAIAELTKTELKVWWFLSKNRNKSISTSCRRSLYIADILNIHESTVKKAIARLKELKFPDDLLNNWS